MLDIRTASLPFFFFDIENVVTYSINLTEKSIDEAKKISLGTSEILEEFDCMTAFELKCIFTFFIFEYAAGDALVVVVLMVKQR